MKPKIKAFFLSLITASACVYLTACFNFDMEQSGGSFKKRAIKNDSILLLELSGVITSELSEDFMSHVRKYADSPKIKGVLVRINSPGGAVGASQEINSAIREVREFYKKPIYVSGGDTVASGAVYSIVSADKIFVNPGTLFGSIGVLMEFQDVSELIRWAKMDIYHLKAGEFKDSGTSYRKMTLRERELFENLLESTLDQFKEAIAKGRNLDLKAVERFADGRIFSGSQALEFGLVDDIGAFNSAIKAIGAATGLGANPHLFNPGAKTAYEKLFDRLSGKPSVLGRILPLLYRAEKLSARPLYILPSYVSPL